LPRRLPLQVVFRFPPSSYRWQLFQYGLDPLNAGIDLRTIAAALCIHWKPKPKAKWVTVEKQANTRIPVPPTAAQGRQNLPPSLWFHYFPIPGADESFCKWAQAPIAAATLQLVIKPSPTILPHSWRPKHITGAVQIMVRILYRPSKWSTLFFHHEPRSKHSVGYVADSRLKKILNSPEEMNAVSTKVVTLFFPPVCPFAPSIFCQVTPVHVLHSQPHLIWHVLAVVTSHNMPK
jgi:hypothetical protein